MQSHRLISRIPLLLYIIFFTITPASLSPLGEEDASEEESMLLEMEMGPKEGDETKPKPTIEVDFETKEQFKRDYFKSGTKKRKLYEAYLPKLGADWILNWLEIIHKACHAHAHDFGMALFAQVKDIGIALNQCRTRCTSGCMHGVVMEAFGESSLNEITNKIDSFCESEVMRKIHKPGNCAHGIGHALMAVTHNNIEKSIDACSSFTNPAMGYYCATGVFMEYHGSNKGNEENNGSHYPCDIFTRYPAACYRYKIPEILKNSNRDVQTVAEECLALPKNLRLGCFHGLGTGKVLDIFNHPELIAKICKYGNSDDQAVCIEGAIEKIADFDNEKAIAACEPLERENRKVCMAAAAGKMYRLEKPTMDLYIDGRRSK